MGRARAWSNKWSQVFLPNDSGPVQLPRTFLLTKQVHHTTWKFPTLATMQQKRTCIGKCANKGFCKCQKCLIRNFSWMYFRRPHQIRSIYISKSFLGLAISGLLFSMGLGYKFQQGSLFLSMSPGSMWNYWLYVIWERNSHLPSTAYMPEFALFYIYPCPFFIHSKIFIKLLLFTCIYVGQMD